MNETSHISIFVQKMRVMVRVGLMDFEHAAPQALDVSVQLYAAPNYLAVAVPEKLIDYAVIHDKVRAWEERPQVLLLETLVCELLDLAFGFDTVQAARVLVAKPDIFDTVEGAGVEAFMKRGDYEAIFS